MKERPSTDIKALVQSKTTTNLVEEKKKPLVNQWVDDKRKSSDPKEQKKKSRPGTGHRDSNPANTFQSPQKPNLGSKSKSKYEEGKTASNGYF